MAELPSVQSNDEERDGKPPQNIPVQDHADEPLRNPPIQDEVRNEGLAEQKYSPGLAAPKNIEEANVHREGRIPDDVLRDEQKEIRPTRYWLLYVCALAVMFFVALQSIYILKDKLPTYSQPIWIHFGTVLCVSVLALAFALAVVAGWFTEKLGRRRALIGVVAVIGLLAICSAPLFFEVDHRALGQGNILEVGKPLSELRQVFFPNGLPDPYPFELSQLKTSLARFSSCRDAHASVVGFASSATFPRRNFVKNKVLANDRAKNVSNFVIACGIPAEAKQWDKYTEMVSARGHIDVNDSGGRLRDQELTNRRVDILIVVPRDCLLAK